MEQNNLITIDILMVVQIINFLILVYFFNKFFVKNRRYFRKKKNIALKELNDVKEEREKLQIQKRKL